MATLERPAGHRVQDVAARTVPIEAAPATGLAPTGEPSSETGGASAAQAVTGEAPAVTGEAAETVAARASQSVALPPVGPLPRPAFRIYFPAAASAGAPPLAGPFPLVIFAHGQRDPDADHHPDDPDPDRDYQRWGGVLHLLARTGIVVASVQMAGTLAADPDAVEEAARRIRLVEQWMHEQWEHRDMLRTWTIDGNRRDHRRNPLGLAGHSFGILGCARVAREGDGVQALAGVDATWNNEAFRDVADARVPSLFVRGAQSPAGIPSTDPPWHVATVAGAGHWDWFDEDGLTPPVSEGEARCQEGHRIAGELLAVFAHRYLNDRSNLAPSLLTMRRIPVGFGRWHWVHDTADRPSLSLSDPCGLEVEWHVDEQPSWDEPVDPAGSESL